MSNLNNRTVTCNECGVTDLHKSETTVVTQHETRDMPLFYCKDWKCMAGRISFDEVIDVYDTHGYDREVEVAGYDVDGVEYTAVGMESCGEIVEIYEDSIEMVI